MPCLHVLLHSTRILLQVEVVATFTCSTAGHIYMLKCKAHVCCSVLQCILLQGTFTCSIVAVCCSVFRTFTCSTAKSICIFCCKAHSHMSRVFTATHCNCNTLQLQHTASCRRYSVAHLHVSRVYSTISCIVLQGTFTYSTVRHIYMFYCKAQCILLQGTCVLRYVAVYSTARHMCVAVCCSVFYCNAHLHVSRVFYCVVYSTASRSRIHVTVE